MSSNFLLASKRQVLRSEAPYDQHFVCELRGTGTYGVWLNVKKLREADENDQLSVLSELMNLVNG
jgi:hypothetical protein